MRMVAAARDRVKMPFAEHASLFDLCLYDLSLDWIQQALRLGHLGFAKLLQVFAWQLPTVMIFNPSAFIAGQPKYATGSCIGILVSSIAMPSLLAATS